MSLTSMAKRQAGVSTAPPGYTGYTMQGGSYALKQCKNGGKWTTTGTLGYCDNQLCTSCSGAWKSCTDDVATRCGDQCRTHTVLQSPGASLATPFIGCGTDVYTFYREVRGRDVVTQPTSSSSTSQPSINPDTPGAGYSTSDKIALGIGLGLGLPTLLITAWGIFQYKSRSRSRP